MPKISKFSFSYQQQQLLDFANATGVPTEATTDDVEINQLQDSINANTTFIFNTTDGQQIVLDQQGILALAASGGEVPEFVTADGQQIVLQNTPQEILSAIGLSDEIVNSLLAGQHSLIADDEMSVLQRQATNQDILAAALAGTEAFNQDQFMGDVLIQQAANGGGGENIDQSLIFHAMHQPPVTALTNETNAVLTQPPIMSTLVQPTKADTHSPSTSLEMIGQQNLDQSLAVIGVTTGNNTNVPTSLELPITITNPAIAPRTISTPISLSSIYPSSASVVGLTTSNQVITSIPSASENELSYDLFSSSIPISHHHFSETLTMAPEHTNQQLHQHHQQQQLLVHRRRQLDRTDEIHESLDLDPNSEIVPVTPESVTNHARTPEMTGFSSDNSNSSSEIPLQQNLVLQPNSFTPHSQPRRRQQQHQNLQSQNRQNYISINNGNVLLDEDSNPGFSDANQYIEEQQILVRSGGQIVSDRNGGNDDDDDGDNTNATDNYNEDGYSNR